MVDESLCCCFGLIVAIGAQFIGASYLGLVCIYLYNGIEIKWIKRGSDFVGSSTVGYAVSLVKNDEGVAIGSPGTGEYDNESGIKDENVDDTSGYFTSMADNSMRTSQGGS